MVEHVDKWLAHTWRVELEHEVRVQYGAMLTAACVLVEAISLAFTTLLVEAWMPRQEEQSM